MGNLKKLVLFRQAHHERNEQAHHERNQQDQDELNLQITVRPKPVKRLNQSFTNALIILMAFLISNVGVAYADDGLTAKELLGRKIYREGSDGSQTEITATLGSAEKPIPATPFACANCHGLEGEGKQEGGLTIPGITSEHLFASVFSSISGKNYDEDKLARAITKGINAQNKILNSAMPKYGLTEKQAQGLLAYLKRLGSASDADTGVTTSEIHLATLLPLTGSLAATGTLLKATLNACIADVNNQGLIYGRKLTLTTLDSGSAQEEILASTKRLLSETKPFALISGYFPEVTTDIYQLLLNEKIPVIAPLSFIPNASLPSSSFFYFLPSYVDQSRALVDYWLDHLPHSKNSVRPKLAIVHSDKAISLDVAVAVREQLRIHHLDVAAEISMSQATQDPASRQITKLAKAKPDAVFFIGDAKEVKQLNASIAEIKPQPLVLGLLAMLGADVLNNPDLAITQILLATPFAPSDPGLQQFTALLDQHSVNLQSPGLQRIACAGVNFVAEGLKHTGKRVSRVKFIHTLEGIKDFPVDIMPPLQFDSNNRQGIKGAYIFALDSHKNTLWSPSTWVTPTEAIK